MHKEDYTFLENGLEIRYGDNIKSYMPYKNITTFCVVKLSVHIFTIDTKESICTFDADYLAKNFYAELRDFFDNFYKNEK